MNARALRRGVAQLWDPPIDGLRHPPELVRVGLAFLPEAPVREPLVKGLGLLLFASFGGLFWLSRQAEASD